VERALHPNFPTGSIVKKQPNPAMNIDTHRRKILILASNPAHTSRLRLDQEAHDIDEALRRAKQRDQFILQQRWAVRPRDVQRAILEIEPHIVHFSGHGAGEEGLVLENEAGQAQFVEAEALAGLFELFTKQIECVILNACYSEVQAEAIVRHIPYVIGMSQAIEDRAAIEFAVGFYDALGVGRSIEVAFRFGCNAVQMTRPSEADTPILKQNFNLTVAPSNPPQGDLDGQRHRLEERKKILQEEWQERHNILGRLRTALLTESDTARQIQLEHQIQERESHLALLEEQLSEIEGRLSKT
jgi:CHAT domain